MRLDNRKVLCALGPGTKYFQRFFFIVCKLKIYLKDCFVVVLKYVKTITMFLLGVKSKYFKRIKVNFKT